MGTANRVINILVLVTAIAVAVFSFMLFNKREQMVKGWKELVTAIEKTGRTIDDSNATGTKLGTALTTKTLHHTTIKDAERGITEFGQKLSALNSETTKVIAQRNSLAESIDKITDTLEIKDEKNLENLKLLTEYVTRRADIEEKVQQIFTRNEKVFNSYASVSTTLEVPVTVADLKDMSKTDESLRKVSDKAKDTTERNARYIRHIKMVASTLSISTPELSGDDYQDSLKTVVTKVEEYRDTFEQTKSDLEKEKVVTTNLKKQIEKKDQEIAKNISTIEKQKSEITRLVKIIDPDGNMDTANELDKPVQVAEILRAVKGRIAYIDEKFGFVTINIGSKNQIIRKIGAIETKVDAPVKVGEVMTIARNLDTVNPVFSGKIKIISVDEFGAVANVLPLPKGKEKPQVGDVVYFADMDIAAIEKADSAAKKDAIAAVNGAAKEDNADKAADADADPEEE